MKQHPALNHTARPYRLSVVMIVKNEAKNLELSLPALKGWIDELIVLDSGSTDHSRQLVEDAGGQWFENLNWPGFGKQRQLAQSYATGEWILALDADEVVTEQLQQNILKAIQQPPLDTVFGIKRLDCIFGHQIDNAYWPVKAHWRLFPKGYQYDNNLVHESVVLNGAKTEKLQGFLLHQTAPTPKFWLEKRLDYAKAWAVDREQRGKTVGIWGVFFHTFWAFIKQYLIDGRFLMGQYGFIYSLLFTQYTFNKYAILYDLKNNHALATFNQSLENIKKLQPVDQSEKKSTVSLVMIAKNESKHLAACLATVHDLVDEIIILDSGSTDQTEEIAKRFGVKWYVNCEWKGFGIQRQIAQSYATQDYVLVLDPDERLDQALRESIVEVLKHPLQTDKVFSLARVNQFCGVEVQKRFWYADRLARLYANKSFQYSSLEVHESLDQKNVPAVKLNGYLEHLTNDDLHHFLVKNIRYSHDWASDKFKHGKKIGLFAAVSRGIFSFIREYIIRGDFLGGAYGYLLAMASMGYTLDKYLMLWQMNKESNKK